jgi:hypothetical protein
MFFAPIEEIKLPSLRLIWIVKPKSKYYDHLFQDFRDAIACD